MNIATNNEEVRAAIYDGVTQQYKDDHRREYRRYQSMCSEAQRNLRRLWDAKHPYSDEADGWRYPYDYAITELQSLDRGAHEAVMLALRMNGC